MGYDNLSDKDDHKPQLDKTLKLLLATISLSSCEDIFIQNGILTIHDLQNQNPDLLISMGILNRGQYDDLMGICATVASISTNGEPFNPDQYQESILSSHYGKRLRESIFLARHSRISEEFDEDLGGLSDVNTMDSSFSSSKLNQSTSRYSFLSNASDDSLGFIEFEEIERQMGITRAEPLPNAIQSRHTVDVSRVQRSFAQPAVHSFADASVPTSTVIQPRATVAVPLMEGAVEPRMKMNHMEVIQENTYCDGLREISGGVYDDPNGKSSFQVLIASLNQPSPVTVTSSSVTIPTQTRDQRSHSVGSFAFPTVMVQESTDKLVSDTLSHVTSFIEPLFSGQCFTVLLYGSLMSPASAMLLSPSVETCIPTKFGNELLQRCKDHEWSLGVSCFMFNDNIASDLLNNNDRRTVMDSGSIIFMKGMKCYATDTEDEILAVLRTAQETMPAPPPAASSTVVVFQLITPQGQYGARAAFILLPPCDRVVPAPQGSANSYHNNNAIPALSNISRIFENRVRQPFRDNKLTLYMRPFLLSTSTILIGCLPPFDDTKSSIPAAYLTKTVPGPRRISRFAPKPKTSGLSPAKNTDNFVSILRYCARLSGQREVRTTRSVTGFSQNTHTHSRQSSQSAIPTLRTNTRVDVAALNRDGAELLKQLNIVETLAKNYSRSYTMSMRSRYGHISLTIICLYSFIGTLVNCQTKPKV